MSTGEIWRIPASLPAVMVSSEGRIMVIPHKGEMPNGGGRWYGGRPTWGVWSKTDRRFIYVYKGQTYKVHRLICEAFHGAPTAEKPVAMHLNENSADNRADNIQWGTQAENLNAPGFISYCRSRTGENSPIAKGRAKKP